MKNKIILAVVTFMLTATAGSSQTDSLKRMKPTCPRLSDTMLIRISEIEVYPEYMDEYLEFALTVGEISVREEPGVVAIFPMIQQRDSCQIRILEIYADREAYQHHIGTEHFQTFKQGTLHMVKRLDLVDMIPMNRSSMPEIFRKLSPKTYE